MPWAGEDYHPLLKLSPSSHLAAGWGPEGSFEWKIEGRGDVKHFEDVSSPFLSPPPGGPSLSRHWRAWNWYPHSLSRRVFCVQFQAMEILHCRCLGLKYFYLYPEDALSRYDILSYHWLLTACGWILSNSFVNCLLSHKIDPPYVKHWDCETQVVRSCNLMEFPV